MPTVAVYVSARDWERLGRDGDRIRRIAKEAIRRELDALAPTPILPAVREFRGPDPKPSARK